VTTSITRKQFFFALARIGAGAVGAAALAACGSSSDSKPDAAPQPMGNCLQNGTAVVIGTNHGHTMTVAKADVTAAVPKTYDIAGASLHTHTVTLTAAHFATLATNFSVTVTSTSDGTHAHAVTVSCA
jgi:hypothetical protein